MDLSITLKFSFLLRFLPESREIEIEVSARVPQLPLVWIFLITYLVFIKDMV